MSKTEKSSYGGEGKKIKDPRKDSKKKNKMTKEELLDMFDECATEDKEIVQEEIDEIYNFDPEDVENVLDLVENHQDALTEHLNDQWHPHDDDNFDHSQVNSRILIFHKEI